MTCGIYKFTNILTNKSYIGQSINIERRIKQHLKDNNKFVFGNALSKYGIDNFKIDIIAVCPKSCLDLLEIVFIRELNTIVPNGYNLSHGGDSFMKGRSFSEEHKHNISISNTGKKRTNEMNLAQSIQRTNYFNTTESYKTREKISRAKKGKPSSRKGIPLTEKQKLTAINNGISRRGKNIGRHNPASVPITYNNINFECKRDLAKYLGISRKLLDYRIMKGIIEVLI